MSGTQARVLVMLSKRRHFQGFQLRVGAWHAQVTLEVSGSEAGARVVKARLERTSLGQVARRIRAVLKPSLTHQVRGALTLRPETPLAHISICLQMQASAITQLGSGH